MLSSGDDHMFSFSTIKLQKVIVSHTQYPFVTDGNQLLSKCI